MRSCYLKLRPLEIERREENCDFLVQKQDWLSYEAIAQKMCPMNINSVSLEAEIKSKKVFTRITISKFSLKYRSLSDLFGKDRVGYIDNF